MVLLRNPAARPPDAPARPGPGETIPIGRQTEWRRLEHLRERACGGQTRVALLSGEPGSGKSALLRAFAAHCARAGATVLCGSGSQALGLPRLLPWIEAIAGHVRATPLDRLRAETEGIAPALLPLLPELAERLAIAPRRVRRAPAQTRLQLYQAVGELLARLAAQHPLVLVFDDLERVHRANLDLLCYVAHQIPNSRLLVLGGCPAGAAAQTPLADTVAELQRQGQLSVLALGPLAAPDLATLAVERLGDALAPAAGERLATLSAGNPGLADAWLRHWQEIDALQFADAGWTLVEAEACLPVPLAVAMRRWLAALPTATRMLLPVLADRGEPAGLNELATAVGQAPETIAEWLRPAVQGGQLDQRSETYVIRHETLRRYLADTIGPTRPARWQPPLPGPESRHTDERRGAAPVPADAARADSLSPARTIGPRPPAPLPFPRIAQRAAELSPREVAVLELIAAGQSNRQIARKLHLSEKTVANHITAIFNKIGVDNRAAAATFACHAGLG